MSGLLILLSIAALAPTGALADCECGYAAAIGPATSQRTRFVFTDLLETDFAHLSGNVSADTTGWSRQQYNFTLAANRGRYGESFLAENVVANPSADPSRFVSGTGADGTNPPGLRLLVKPVDEANGPKGPSGELMVPTAEISSARLDMLYGSFRASLKVTPVPGTCAAFFWYFNDTQEIDMEFLSRQFNPSNNTFPVNLVLHSAKSREAGYDASKTGNFVTANLPFDPTAAFHEYRIDFVPGRVFFHADNVLLAEMGGEAVPTSPGHLLLTHWSNGNPLWSGGPPTETAAFEVSYVKAYFNSSDSARQSDWHGRCVDPRANGAVCDIPDVVVAAADDGTFFFSKQGNMTNNQTVFGSNASGRTRGADAELVWRPVFLGSVVLTGLWAAGLL